jgi:hypothetical protein
VSDEIYVHAANIRPVIKFRSIRQKMIGAVLDTLLNKGILFSWAYIVKAPYRRIEFQLYFEQDAMISCSMKDIEILLLGMYIADPKQGSNNLLTKRRTVSKIEDAPVTQRPE